MAPHKQIPIKDYKYYLPEAQVPKFPTADRDGSRLLVYDDGCIIDDQFRSITEYIKPHSLMVFNNTKVIRARIAMQKSTGAQLEVFCLEPTSPAEYNAAFQATGSCEWLCMVGNLKKWKDGFLEKELFIDGITILFRAEKIERLEKEVRIKFSWNSDDTTFAQILEIAGHLPIPPYLNRDTEDEDYDRYQTIYSRHKGSVAAPTAGLHFTDTVFINLRECNIDFAEVTLHVGAGTFRPVQSDTLEGHDMHTEHIVVHRYFLELLRDSIGSVIAVGTTSVRTIESLYWLAVRIVKNVNSDLKVCQWDPYELVADLAPQEAIDVLIKYCDDNNLSVLAAETQVMIVPGYKWKFVNQIVTNFHQPESTLLLLVSAFIGEDWQRVYAHAVKHGYRFLSYGDSSILSRSKIEF